MSKNSFMFQEGDRIKVISLAPGDLYNGQKELLEKITSQTLEVIQGDEEGVSVRGKDFSVFLDAGFICELQSQSPFPWEEGYEY